MSVYTIAATMIVGGIMMGTLAWLLGVHPLSVALGSLAIGGLWVAYEVYIGEDE